MSAGERFAEFIPWGELTWTQRYFWVRGMLRKSRSCGKKQRYPHRAAADKAGLSMSKKTGRVFDTYRCMWCHKYHIGGSVKL